MVTRDAVAYAEQISNTIQYDFIIHDVFTGGAEPIPLFTREFLSSLKDSLNAKGSIAIVGVPSRSDSLDVPVPEGG